MVVSAAALQRLSLLRRRVGGRCVGFRFDGAIGSCRFSTPILMPVTAPVAGAREFHAGEVSIFAAGELAGVLEVATLDYDATPLFGRGLVVSWPHREGGCPNCR
jgi:hypothetical protein